MEQKWFCDCCLMEFNSSGTFSQHIRSQLHRGTWSAQQVQIRKLFATAQCVLIGNDGEWERCFSCGAARVSTVVSVTCCRCDGSGGCSPEPEGVPGQASQEGSQNQRFLCLEHALEGYCRSCASFLGVEAFAIDPDAMIDASRSAGSHQ